MTQGGKGNKRHILVEKDIIFKTNGLTNIKTIQKLDQVTGLKSVPKTIWFCVLSSGGGGLRSWLSVSDAASFLDHRDYIGISSYILDPYPRFTI